MDEIFLGIAYFGSQFELDLLNLYVELANLTCSVVCTPAYFGRKLSFVLVVILERNIVEEYL